MAKKLYLSFGDYRLPFAVGDRNGDLDYGNLTVKSLLELGPDCYEWPKRWMETNR
jgi:hypothetical protein